MDGQLASVDGLCAILSCNVKEIGKTSTDQAQLNNTVAFSGGS